MSIIACFAALLMCLFAGTVLSPIRQLPEITRTRPARRERRWWTRELRRHKFRNAITKTDLTSGSDNTSGTTATTASVTPTTNSLQLLAVSVARLGASGTLSVTGCSLTWVQEDTRDGSSHRISVFRALGTPTTGALTITSTATENVFIWAWSEFAGVDTTGTNGSGACVQSVVGGAGSGTSLSVTLAAFGSANNATYGAFTHNTNEVHTPGSGFTEIHDLGASNVAAIAVMTEWKTTNDTGVDASWATNSTNSGIAIEIKAASAGSPWYQYAQQ